MAGLRIEQLIWLDKGNSSHRTTSQTKKKTKQFILQQINARVCEHELIYYPGASH